MSIFLKVEADNSVSTRHFKPFDEVVGLHKTQEQLEQIGVLVDAIPERPEPMIGKKLVLYVEPLRWEYVDRELTREEKLQALVDSGVLTQEQMNELL